MKFFWCNLCKICCTLLVMRFSGMLLLDMKQLDDCKIRRMGIGTNSSDKLGEEWSSVVSYEEFFSHKLNTARRNLTESSYLIF